MKNLHTKTQQELHVLYEEQYEVESSLMHPWLLVGILYGLMSPLFIFAALAIKATSAYAWVRVVFIMIGICAICIALVFLYKYFSNITTIRKRYQDAQDTIKELNEEIKRRHEFYLEYRS